MKIAQIAPLWEEIPPPKYGGTERIVSYLTEGLVNKGHDVTLYACGSSKTKAELISIYPKPLFRDGIPWTDIMYPLLNIAEAFENHESYDILHMHLNKSSDYIALPLAKRIKDKVVFTLHFPYPLSQNRVARHQVFQKYKELNYVSISNTQREGGENLNWIGTVYNGIDLTPYTFHEKPKNYFAWLGKFNPDKGFEQAAMAAEKANVMLRVAGKIDNLEDEDFEYYKNTVKALLDKPHVEYIGEVNDKQKNDLFGNALALLNPIKWNEPFGLVMTEAMATGTPVISFANGAAKEIVTDRETGYLVNDVDEMVEKMNIVEKIERKKCRERVEKYFSKETMVNDYIKVYKKLIGQN